MTLFFSWCSGGDALTPLLAAAGFASFYWATKPGAICRPNTLYFDPEFDLPKNAILGLPAQAMFQIVFLSLAGTCVILGLRTILSTSVEACYARAGAGKTPSCYPVVTVSVRSWEPPISDRYGGWPW